jgi:Domain of unknown function (DUF4149)
VIGFLRFIGIINAAIWLGGTVFFALFAEPAFFSPDMHALLEAKNFPYFSGAIAQIVAERYYHFHLICAVIAFLQLLAEWLYLGRPGRKVSFSLLAGLLVLGLFGDHWLQPKLKTLHRTRFLVSAQPAEREAAARSFGAWQMVDHLLELCVIGGLIVYVWRAANPSDTLRFVSSVKFRGDR